MNFGGKGTCVNCGKEMEGGGGSFGGPLSTTWRRCECGMQALFYTIQKDYEIGVRAEHKDHEKNRIGEKEKLLSIFKLADIKILTHWNIENGYYGKEADWLLLKTDLGLIEIGWRKSVISINWKDTGIKHTVKDEVTKDDFSVHAWSYEKAIEYLTGLRRAAEQKE